MLVHYPLVDAEASVRASRWQGRLRSLDHARICSSSSSSCFVLFRALSL
jgi:hypothetical protein